MAMEATHVRFARDLAERLGVSDFAAYYSGAVYPDSRYATGIPRTATHNDPLCPQDPFQHGLGDFEKGWATHLLYDHESMMARRSALTMVSEELRKDDWAFFTSVKLVEDMESVRQLGEDMRILRELKMTERPCGEAVEPMERYYADLRAAYAPACDDASDYRAFSVKLGIAPDRADRMVALAERFLSDPATATAILNVYPTVVSRYAR